MVFVPSFYTAKESDAAKVDIYLLYILCGLVGGLFLYEHFFNLTSIHYTDAFLTPSDIPYYAIMPTNMQSATARYGINFFIINTSYVMILSLMTMFLFPLINLRRRTVYILTLIIGFAVGASQLLKSLYYGWAYLNCVSFWFCRTRDLSLPIGTPSYEFTSMIFVNMGYFLVIGGHWILIFFLDKIMALVVKNEGDEGAIIIASSTDNQKQRGEGDDEHEKNIIEETKKNYPQEIMIDMFERIEPRRTIAFEIQKTK